MAVLGINRVLNRLFVARKTKFTSSVSSGNYLLNVRNIDSEFGDYAYVNKTGENKLPNNGQVWPYRTYKYSSESAEKAYSSTTTKKVYIENLNWDANSVNTLEANNETYFYSGVSRTASSTGYYMESDTNKYYYINSRGLITSVGTYVPVTHDYVFTYLDGTTTKSDSFNRLALLKDLNIISKDNDELVMISESNITKSDFITIDSITSSGNNITIILAIPENTTTATRIGSVTIKQPGSNKQIDYEFTQIGVSEYTFTKYDPTGINVALSSSGGSKTFKLTSKKGTTGINILPSGISLRGDVSGSFSSPSLSGTTVSTTLTYAANTSSSTKTGVVTFTQPTSELTQTYTLTQDGAGHGYVFEKVRPITAGYTSLDDTVEIVIKSSYNGSPLAITKDNITYTMEQGSLRCIINSVTASGDEYTIIAHLVHLVSTTTLSGILTITQPNSGNTLVYTIKVLPQPDPFEPAI